MHLRQPQSTFPHKFSPHGGKKAQKCTNAQTRTHCVCVIWLLSLGTRFSINPSSIFHSSSMLFSAYVQKCLNPALQTHASAVVCVFLCVFVCLCCIFAASEGLYYLPKNTEIRRRTKKNSLPETPTAKSNPQCHLHISDGGICV